MESKAETLKNALARLALPALAFVTLALMARLFFLVDAHAVNLPYYDQLDFYEVFKTDASPWEVFRYQHGPHRQGLPFLGTQLVAHLTDWNFRADAFYVAAYIFAATGLALFLRHRLQGSLSLSDIAIPLLLLTPAQYGVFIHTPNASHGAAPLFFLMLYCLSLTHRNRIARYAALLLLNFIMLHTGFAFFVGAITPLLLAIFTYQDVRRSGWGSSWSGARLPASAFLISLLSIAVFFWHYTEKQGLDRVQGTEDWTLYPKYLSALFANVLGLKNTSGADPSLPLAAGAFGGFAIFAVAVWSFGRLLRPSSNDATEPSAKGNRQAGSLPPNALAAVCFTLTTFTLLYGIATAIGRVHLGISGAQSTRYVPLVVPAFLGLYLATSAIGSERTRKFLGAMMVVALIAASFPMRESESRFMHRLSASKHTWIATYLETNDIRSADRAARLRVYPFVGPQYRTAEKFEYMRKHGLSFFADLPNAQKAGSAAR